MNPPVSFRPKVISFLGYDPNSEPQTIGERITVRRRALEIDHRQAAKLIDVDYGTLLRYERGEGNAKGERSLRVMKFIQTP